MQVPICYAGSLNPAARVQRKRVSETFGAQVARAVQTLPAVAAVSRLVDELRGVNVPTVESPLIPAAATVVGGKRNGLKKPDATKGRKASRDLEQ